MSEPCCTPSRIPIACSLDAGGLAERRRRFRDLAARLLLRSERSGGAARFEFRADSAETEAAVRELASLEKECCPFFDLSVSAASGVVRLEVSGPEEARPAVEALYEMIVSER
ncbi:MAG: hypothetical protein ACREQ9_06640 [Candidatus Binatia bacterium]